MSSTSSSPRLPSPSTTSSDRTSPHHYNIRGIPVSFPYAAYPNQLLYMDKTIAACEHSQHALLESPTGTGKTVSLLCSVLAWARHYTERLVREAAVLAAGNPSLDIAQLRFPSLPSAFSQSPLTALGQPPPSIAARPRVIYSSRTHSQLSKVVSELKRTAYTPRVTLLGSRQQLCIHDDVKGLTGLQQNHACHALVNRHECVYYETLASEMQRNNLFSASPTGNTHSAALSASACMDIEDLVQYGTDHKLCPYFLTREALPHSELVLLPYNYLIEPTIRDKLNLSLQNAVIIFDEAHNLDAVCTDAASIDLSVIEIGQAVAEVQRVLEEVQTIQSESEQQRQADPWASKHAMSAAMGGKVPELHSVAILKVLLLEMERVIDSHELRDEEKGETRDGAYMYELLNQCKIGSNSHSVMLQLVDECVDFLLRMEEGALSRGSRRRGTSALSKVAQVLRVLFAGGEERWREAAKDYRVHLHIKHAKKRVWSGPGSRGRGGPFQRQSNRTADDDDTDNSAVTSSAASSSHTSSYRVLSYWCFNPGLSMQSLAQCGVRTFLFTSGTLSPLDSFAAEFHMAFPIRLENEHIIAASQLLLVTLTHGPACQPLLSSYINRSNREYMLDLGNAIVNFVRMVPDGVLVFFPSYGVMDAMVACWESGGVMVRIREKKAVVMEPRVSGEMSECIAEYQRAIEHSAATGLTGALMLAVCRGKVSEGLDFADANGRAVIITGLPYPALHEPKVRIKREFLDQRHAASPATSPLTGGSWYQQQASRAVNQAIGRVIRHVNDYGAILLCDKRFAQTDQRMQLSSWVRGRMEVHERFGGVIGQVRGFFKRMEGDRVPRSKVRVGLTGGLEGSSRPAVEKRLTASDERKEAVDVSGGEGVNRKRQAVDVGFASLLDDSYSALRDGLASTPSSASSPSSALSASSGLTSTPGGVSPPLLSTAAFVPPTGAQSFRAVVDSSSAAVRPSLPTSAGHRSLFAALQPTNPVRGQTRPD